MGLVATKPVFGASDKARLNPVSTATETSSKIESSLVASLDMVLSKQRITKALIRLRGCAGWSSPLLFANLRRQVCSRRGPNYMSYFQVFLKIISYQNCQKRFRSAEIKMAVRAKIRSFFKRYKFLN